MIHVAGWCPFGCGQTLYLREGVWNNYVECSYAHCPRPTGVSDLLIDDAGVIDHIVELDGDSYIIHHPLQERISGDLFCCKLHSQLGGLKLMFGQFRKGTFKVSIIDGKYDFQEVE